MSEARVERAIPAYLGFETKVTCPGEASSIPVTPVTVGLSVAFSSFPPSRCANSCSFMGAILVGAGKNQNMTRILRVAPILKASSRWSGDLRLIVEATPSNFRLGIPGSRAFLLRTQLLKYL